VDGAAGDGGGGGEEWLHGRTRTGRTVGGKRNLVRLRRLELPHCTLGKRFISFPLSSLYVLWLFEGFVIGSPLYRETSYNLQTPKAFDCIQGLEVI